MCYLHEMNCAQKPFLSQIWIWTLCFCLSEKVMVYLMSCFCGLLVMCGRTNCRHVFQIKRKSLQMNTLCSTLPCNVPSIFFTLSIFLTNGRPSGSSSDHQCKTLDEWCYNFIYFFWGELYFVDSLLLTQIMCASCFFVWIGQLGKWALCMHTCT